VATSVVTQYGALEIDRRVGNTYCVHLTGRRIIFFFSEGGVGKFLQNVLNFYKTTCRQLYYQLEVLKVAEHWARGYDRVKIMEFDFVLILYSKCKILLLKCSFFWRKNYNDLQFYNINYIAVGQFYDYFTWENKIMSAFHWNWSVIPTDLLYWLICYTDWSVIPTLRRPKLIHVM
jgi:hypothetical protein